VKLQNKMNKDQINLLLQKMTLEEKAGQATQLPTRYFDIKESQLTGTENKLGITENQKWQAGSILGKLDAVSMRRLQAENLKRSRLKIPMMFMTDIIHGYQTIFPIPLALACSFNEELAEKSARIAAAEGSAAGYQVTFSPMVDVVTDPRWGRIIESFGEDKKLNADMGRAMVRGYQGENLKEPNSLAACVKHFAAYGKVEGGRDYNAADVSEYTLQNQYFPPFKACIDAGAKLVMAAFQAINGIPATASKWLLQDKLRKELEFSGIVISDWGAVAELIRHGVAQDEYDSGELALSAGIQIEMATSSVMKNIRKYVELEPEIESLLDQAVEKILTLKAELGLFEDPFRGVDETREKRELRSRDKKHAAWDAAIESAVLLENNGILPLEKETPLILAGPYADSKDILGPWSVDGVVEDTVSIRQGVINRGGNITQFIPLDFEEISDQDMDKVLVEAKKTKLAVLALGEPELWSGEAGSKSAIELPKAQCMLVEKLYHKGIKVIVLLLNGRPLDLRPIQPYADAILELWFPGTEGGSAAADLLYGNVNPSGHLAMSFPYGSGQIPVHYNMGATGRPKEFLINEKRYKSQYLDIPNEPLYAFGYGLSYTDFLIEINGEIKKSTDERYMVPVKVTNTGKVAGKAVVQIYIRKQKSKVARPVKELAAYKKVELKPDEQICMEIALEKDIWNYWIPNEGWTKESGNYTIMIGADSQHFICCNLLVD
jgi:beta-glucosidase